MHYNLGLRGQRVSVTAAMSTRGIEDIDITGGTVNGEGFSQFIECSILPIMNPSDGTNPRSILIFDNASIHHVNRGFYQLTVRIICLWRRFLAKLNIFLKHMKLSMIQLKV